MADRPLILALSRLADGHDLTVEESADAVLEIMAGKAAEPEIAAFLTALRIKGETADELAGAVRAVRERMTPLELEPSDRPLLDTCGTGGDGASTVNVSTATAIVASACGLAVVKHGNRSASGRSGSAEVLHELGIGIESELDLLKRCLVEQGITFLYAPRFHPALRHAVSVRKRLPFRTLFNLVGPLANPARPEFQLVGVAGERQADLVASALTTLGVVKRAAVVTGSDGLDEVTLAGPTNVRLIERGTIQRLTWTPDDFRLPEVPVEQLRIDDPTDGAHRIRRLLEGEPGPIRHIILANTAAAIWTAGRADSLAEAVDQSARAIDSGAALDRLESWIRVSQENG